MSRARGTEGNGDKSIAQALQVLTCYKFCRNQAKRLQRCKKKELAEADKNYMGGILKSFGRKYGSICNAQQSAFETCAREHTELAIKDLMSVAAKFCPREVETYSACMRRTQSQEMCEIEDVECLMCAARKVVYASSTKG